MRGKIDANNSPQIEKEVMDAVASAGDRDIEFDASELIYISSAGLRVLMGVLKTVDGDVSVINASRDVYDIFEVTGFTDLLTVKKAMRKVSVEGCEEIGKGGHGKVYRLDGETIIKVYHDNSTLDVIEKEMKYAKNAFINGVPSAISYDVVSTEEGYGIVYELAGADTVGKAIMKNPERLQDLIVKMANLLKTLNTTEADPELYGDIRQIYLDRAEEAKSFYTPEETDQPRQRSF